MPDTFELVAHRVLDVGSGMTAMLASGSTAWACVPHDQYAPLVGGLPLAADRIPSGLEELWRAGMVARNGAVCPDARPSARGSPSSLLLKMTGACDYVCTYCYDFEPSRWSAKLSHDRMIAALAGLLARRDDLSVVFHGGEPLLRFRAIQAVVATCRERWPDKRIRFAIQTNGSRLTAEIVAFLDREGFSVGLSLDGSDEAANRHRLVRGGPSALERIRRFMDDHPDFVRARCGVVAVVSRSSADAVGDFALWLQDRGVNGLSLSFLDAEGRAEGLGDERLTPAEAVGVYARLVGLIRDGAIGALAVRTLLSRMANLFTFTPTDFCHRGPCAAADEFMVLDAEGRGRTCDCVYDAFFEVDGPGGEQAARDRVIARHGWLGSQGPTCSSCALFGLCGGTCVAKAISANGTPHSVDPVGCALATWFYPEVLAEFAAPGPSPLFDYYERHRGAAVDPFAALAM